MRQREITTAKSVLSSAIYVPTYPETERETVTETLHGESIEDPYRWLEDNNGRVKE